MSRLLALMSVLTTETSAHRLIHLYIVQIEIILSPADFLMHVQHSSLLPHNCQTEPSGVLCLCTNLRR